jgi:hypothetical protein
MTDSTTERIDLPTRSVIRELLQGKILEAVETVIDAELTALLGTLRYERSPERRGYRKGYASHCTSFVGFERDLLRRIRRSFSVTPFHLYRTGASSPGGS